MISDFSPKTLEFYSSTSMSRFRQAVYDRLNFSHVVSSQFQAFKLKERAKQCAFYDAYHSVREWIKRVETLKTIIPILMDSFTTNGTIFESFLTSKRLNSTQLKPFRKATGVDCFGDRQKLSNFFLNNFIFQVRNMFLAKNDFTWSGSNSCSNVSSALYHYIKQEVNSLTCDDTFIEQVSGGFTRKKKKKIVPVESDDLLEYFFSGYIRKIQWNTTKKAGRVVSSWDDIQNEKSRTNPRSSKIKKLSQDIERCIDGIRGFFSDIDFTSLNEFKKKRKIVLDTLKKPFMERFREVNLNHVIFKAFQVELSELQGKDGQYILKRLFKPSFPRIQVFTLNSDSFLEYMTRRLQYKVRELLKEHFLTLEFMELVMSQLSEIKDIVQELVRLPRHETLSISIMNRDVYRETFSLKPDELENTYHVVKLGLVSRDFKHLMVRDDKHRLKTMKERGFDPLLPRITLKNRKVLLHLPFQLTRKKKEHSKPSKQVPETSVEMGIDLGLKHLATISIHDKKNNTEMSRYFISSRQLLDMVFDDMTGKFRNQNRIRMMENSKYRSNIKTRLIRLRQEIKVLQRKKNEYEQRCLKKKMNQYKKRLKWHKIGRDLSQCWARVYRINAQLVNHLNNCIMKIARFWNVSTIKVEDLRFSTHSRKQEAGFFLAFWQVHWFHSQAQLSIKLQSKLHGITFKKVPARNTSRTCSRCGKHGIRSGKLFSCTHCGFQLDSDLNAARNIVKYQSPHHASFGASH